MFIVLTLYLCRADTPSRIPTNAPAAISLYNKELYIISEDKTIELVSANNISEDKNKAYITEKDGKYQIELNGILLCHSILYKSVMPCGAKTHDLSYWDFELREQSYFAISPHDSNSPTKMCLAYEKSLVLSKCEPTNKNQYFKIVPYDRLKSIEQNALQLSENEHAANCSFFNRLKEKFNTLSLNKLLSYFNSNGSGNIDKIDDPDPINPDSERDINDEDNDKTTATEIPKKIVENERDPREERADHYKNTFDTVNPNPNNGYNSDVTKEKPDPMIILKQEKSLIKKYFDGASSKQPIPQSALDTQKISPETAGIDEITEKYPSLSDNNTSQTENRLEDDENPKKVDLELGSSKLKEDNTNATNQFQLANDDLLEEKLRRDAIEQKKIMEKNIEDVNPNAIPMMKDVNTNKGDGINKQKNEGEKPGGSGSKSDDKLKDHHTSQSNDANPAQEKTDDTFKQQASENGNKDANYNKENEEEKPYEDRQQDKELTNQNETQKGHDDTSEKDAELKPAVDKNPLFFTSKKDEPDHKADFLLNQSDRVVETELFDQMLLSKKDTTSNLKEQDTTQIKNRSKEDTKDHTKPQKQAVKAEEQKKSKKHKKNYHQKHKNLELTKNADLRSQKKPSKKNANAKPDDRKNHFKNQKLSKKNPAETFYLDHNPVDGLNDPKSLETNKTQKMKKQTKPTTKSLNKNKSSLVNIKDEVGDFIDLDDQKRSNILAELANIDKTYDLPVSYIKERDKTPRISQSLTAPDEDEKLENESFDGDGCTQSPDFEDCPYESITDDDIIESDEESSVYEVNKKGLIQCLDAATIKEEKECESGLKKIQSHINDIAQGECESYKVQKDEE